jgi:spermidine/putrescine transport system permease protein
MNFFRTSNKRGFRFFFLCLRDRFSQELLLTIPSFFWLFLFFLIPTLIIFAYAFKPYDLYGGVLEGWTFRTIFGIYDYYFISLAWRTFWLSSLTTLLCLLLALPMGYQFLISSKQWRNFLLLMIIVPFWSSFLIRIFAWKTILHPEGGFHQALTWIGLIHSHTTLLYNSSAVLFIMVYTLLPFAVLPIYTAASKFNFQLIEAAMDLGATRTQAFLKVFIPGIRKGIGTAVVMVFIPAVGSYVIPDLVGGSNSEMLGNKIAQKTFVERNLPQASAISAFLALAVFIPLIAVSRIAKRSKRIEAESARGRE